MKNNASNEGEGLVAKLYETPIHFKYSLDTPRGAAMHRL